MNGKGPICVRVMSSLSEEGLRRAKPDLGRSQLVRGKADPNPIRYLAILRKLMNGKAPTRVSIQLSEEGRYCSKKEKFNPCKCLVSFRKLINDPAQSVSSNNLVLFRKLMIAEAAGGQIITHAVTYTRYFTFLRHKADKVRIWPSASGLWEGGVRYIYFILESQYIY